MHQMHLKISNGCSVEAKWFLFLFTLAYICDIYIYVCVYIYLSFQSITN